MNVRCYWGLGALLALSPGACTQTNGRPSNEETPPTGNVVPGGQVTVPGPEGTGAAPLAIDCHSPGHTISPLIYGMGASGERESRQQFPWELNPGARRWGGNSTSRYNWQLGTTNAGSDWFFRNMNLSDEPGSAWMHFIDDNLARGAVGVLTVPTIGWVARDATSFAFPVSVFGPQHATDPQVPDAGDGLSPAGQPLPPGAPELTSIAAPPEMVADWVKAIRAEDATRGGRGVRMYILDNEPTLWHETHRDVHPQPVGYDELLDRAIRYGSAVRAADPEGLIAGPSSWGYLDWSYSAVDLVAGVQASPDRKAHGGVPLLVWYLQQLRAYEQQHGVSLLDVVDVHFYPEAEGIGYMSSGKSDLATSALRIRSTRSLWDPTYKDESWIDDYIRLLPRLKELIAAHYPGRKISIGEWNFGAEQHISSGIAVAEALGRFAQEGIDSAFYWPYPNRGSAAYWGFRAFRNFDGNGGRFQDEWVPASAPAGVSVFASKDPTGTRMVVVALNLEPDRPKRVELKLDGCGTPTAAQAYSWAGHEDGFQPATLDAGPIPAMDVPGWSISVFDLQLKQN